MSINKAVKQLLNAKRVVCFTGAGISAESGIQTFRSKSNNGFWNGLKGKLTLAYFGTPFGWNLTPEFCWKHYIKDFYLPIQKALPNDGHFALNQLRKEFFPDMKIITQNVDGLHQKAGIPEDSVHEIHGSVLKYKCIKKGHKFTIASDHDLNNMLNNFKGYCDINTTPKCQHINCKSFIRPDCTLFLEPLPEEAWNNSLEEIEKLNKGDIMIVCGTSGVVYPAAQLPFTVMERGADVIEINLEKTRLSNEPYCTFLEGKISLQNKWDYLNQPPPQMYHHNLHPQPYGMLPPGNGMYYYPYPNTIPPTNGKKD
ncbi:hypothetical protein ABK040_015208 [Willaertia magna]